MGDCLRDIHRDGYNRGLIKTPNYRSWRGQVVGRINKLFNQNKFNYSNEEIVRYMQIAKFI